MFFYFQQMKISVSLFNILFLCFLCSCRWSNITPLSSAANTHQLLIAIVSIISTLLTEWQPKQCQYNMKDVYPKRENQMELKEIWVFFDFLGGKERKKPKLVGENTSFSYILFLSKIQIELKRSNPLFFPFIFSLGYTVEIGGCSNSDSDRPVWC